MELDSDSGREQEAKRDRKFRIAMVLYGVLAVAIWFTFGEDKIHVSGGQVQIRWIPLLIIGLFAFRTWVAREADKIRRRNQESERGI